MTPARDDLPAVGDEIAALHSMGQWYLGPLTVLAVDPKRRQVTCHQIRWTDIANTKEIGRNYPFNGFVCFDGLRWNLLADLSPAEMEPIIAARNRLARFHETPGRVGRV